MYHWTFEGHTKAAGLTDFAICENKGAAGFRNFDFGLGVSIDGMMVATVWNYWQPSTALSSSPHHRCISSSQNAVNFLPSLLQLYGHGCGGFSGSQLEARLDSCGFWAGMTGCILTDNSLGTANFLGYASEGKSIWELEDGYVVEY